MPSTPEINPATGWKIFRDKNVPITFEYPVEFGNPSLRKAPPPEVMVGIEFQSETYALGVTLFADGKGTDLSKEDDLGSVTFKLQERQFMAEIWKGNEEGSIFKVYTYGDQGINELMGSHRGTIPIQILFRCKDSCDRSEALSILKQIVSSIRLASDTR
jgi:hypothetical protein